MNNHHKYIRQVQLPDFGQVAQDKLHQAKVLIVGAGGLGCPVLLYLAAAGVGHIAIADHDHVQLSNLQRQIIFGEPHIGMYKAQTAAQNVAILHPDIHITPIIERIDEYNAEKHIAAYDIVIETTDDTDTKYLLDNICKKLKKPLIYAAIHGYEGQVAVFHIPDANGVTASYSDLFPPNNHKNIPTCEQGGVLGTLTGIIGCMQATEAIKIITGIGNPLINKLLIYNCLQHTYYDTQILPQHYIPTSVKTQPDQVYADINFMDEIFALYSSTSIVADIREAHEQPAFTRYPTLSLPLSAINTNMNKLLPYNHIFVLCATGKRSMQNAIIMKNTFPQKNIYSIKSGIKGMMLQPA
ncbi:MAG: HesA/MoeB/ThiF family protein [Cytophagales bacterium]|nr:HesA/MoeB/ThiF family protein [Cytophagales bacterium]